MDLLRHSDEPVVDWRLWAAQLVETHSRDQIIDTLADGAESAATLHRQLKGAVEENERLRAALETAKWKLIEVRSQARTAQEAAEAALAEPPQGGQW